jgi:predicted Zn-dependent protease
LEATFDDELEKNRLCTPIPMPDRDIDWLEILSINLANQYLWSRNAELRTWLANSRLDTNQGRSHALSAEETSIAQRFKESATPASAKLRQLLASAAEQN